MKQTPFGFQYQAMVDVLKGCLTALLSDHQLASAPDRRSQSLVEPMAVLLDV